MKSSPLIDLTDRELRNVRGGDLCILGYEKRDTNGDGVPDLIIPIYGECLHSLGTVVPTDP